SASYSGWVAADGERFAVDGFYGSRDRTWGIRDHMSIDMWIWFAAQFDERAIAAWVWERQDGSVMYVDGEFCHEDGTVSAPFVRMEHDVTFDRDLKRPLGAEVVFTDDDGKRFAVSATAEHPNVNVYYGAVPSERWDESDE